MIRAGFGPPLFDRDEKMVNGKRWIMTGCLGLSLVGQAAATAPVAGLSPWERPVGAPVVSKFEQTPQWRAKALRGVSEPATGTDFLKDQGAWFTPFIHPGMPGYYDIRGLHDRSSEKRSKP